MCLAVAGRVNEVSNGFASVAVREHTYRVDAALRPEVHSGDYVVIQAGLIMDIISEEEARALEQYQQEIADLFVHTPDG